MRHMPPGHGARRWLRERLGTTARAIDVLEQKAVALARERRRLRQHFEEVRGAFERAMHEADRWFLRAAAIGGRRQLDLARSRVSESADALIRWRSLMGVAYPAEVRVRLPDPSPMAGVARSSALIFAARAYGKAIQAALDHSAAMRALDLVEAELAVTRRRLRGLESHWMPRLERRLHEVELSLAEEEREDMVRAKWIASKGERRS